PRTGPPPRARPRTSSSASTPSIESPSMIASSPASPAAPLPPASRAARAGARSGLPRWYLLRGRAVPPVLVEVGVVPGPAAAQRAALEVRPGRLDGHDPAVHDPLLPAADRHPIAAVFAVVEGQRLAVRQVDLRDLGG